MIQLFFEINLKDMRERKILCLQQAREKRKYDLSEEDETGQKGRGIQNIGIASGRGIRSEANE